MIKYIPRVKCMKCNKETTFIVRERRSGQPARMFVICHGKREEVGFVDEAGQFWEAFKGETPPTAVGQQ